jgi:hypothetical protein
MKASCRGASKAAWVIAAVLALAPSTVAAQRGWIRPKPPRLLPTARPLPDTVRRFGPPYLTQPRSLLAHLPIPSVPLATGALVTESEPNDTTTTANPVTLGDTVSGVISPANDIDFYAIDLTAGTVVDLDVSAAQVGSPLERAGDGDGPHSRDGRARAAAQTGRRDDAVVDLLTPPAPAGQRQRRMRAQYAT